jgi:hypothetical protein
MSFIRHSAPAVVLATLVSNAFAAGITFGPVKGQPGESVRLVTRSETPGGTIQRTLNGKPGSGTIAITRDRELIWTFRATAPDGTRRGMVRVPMITTATVVKIDGKEEKTNDQSPLTGKMFAMSKTPTGEWKFELDGSVPLTRVRNEIEELTVYLKRDWYPTREVKVGDSWEFDPAWVKMLIEKDLSKAKTIGTMRLRQIRRAANRQSALIDVTIESTGADFGSDGSQAAASIALTGQVVVNLDTMLDEQLDLNGTVTSSSSKPGETTKVTLPIQLKVTKSFVKEGKVP